MQSIYVCGVAQPYRPCRHVDAVRRLIQRLHAGNQAAILPRRVIVEAAHAAVNGHHRARQACQLIPIVTAARQRSGSCQAIAEMRAPLAIWVEGENVAERRKVSDQFIQLALRIGHGAPGCGSLSKGKYASGVPTLRLRLMDKYRVGIGRSVTASSVKGMANGAAMIGAVVDQVEDRFLTAQHILRIVPTLCVGTQPVALRAIMAAQECMDAERPAGALTRGAWERSKYASSFARTANFWLRVGFSPSQ